MVYSLSSLFFWGHSFCLFPHENKEIVFTDDTLTDLLPTDIHVCPVFLC